LPQPKFSDIRRFCQIDGWEEKEGASGKRGDHFRYRKVLEDGRILRTKTSHSDDEIGDPGLWRRIWRDQLVLESEDQFWEALASGDPVDRAESTPTPAGPSLPGWLVDSLIRKVGIAPEEVARMTEQEARDRLNEFYSQPAE
jgi:hypothetical protein